MPTVSPAETESTELAQQLNERSVALMGRVKVGDQAAFAELAALHQQSLIGTAFRLLGNLEDAHDVAQQVLVRIWKSAPRYEPTAKFTTWMFTILRNLAFNEYRRRGRHPVQSLDEGMEEYGQQLTDATAAMADQAMEQKELEEAIDAAIQSLPENQRLAVSLRRYEDLPYEEIASVLEMSLSAVKSLIFRARNELKERLRAHLA
jgi:RNA polymerase sigma-70 factor, ECF subfamily